MTDRFLLAIAFGLALPLLGKTGTRILFFYDGFLFLLYIADYLAGRIRGRFDLERSMPPRLYQNQWTEVCLKIQNRSPWRLRMIVRDGIPASFERRTERWRVSAPIGGETRGTYEISAPQRGAYEFDAIFWRMEGPLGLAWIQGKTAARKSVGVYPELEAVHRLDMALRSRRWEELGFHKARIKGAGNDLRELREYIPGDDIRKIDWKATARQGHPIVREYEPERGQNLHILLDAGRLMENRIYDRSRFDHAVSAALALAYAGIQQGDRVGLMVFADKIWVQIPPNKGRHHLTDLIDALYQVRTTGVESNYDLAFRQLLMGHQKHGIVCLFTELVDELASERLLNRMNYLARHHRSICVTLKDPVLKRFFDEPLTFVDQLYAQGVSLQIQKERERARMTLAGRGVAVLDSAPEDLSLQLITKYLDLKNAVVR